MYIYIYICIYYIYRSHGGHIYIYIYIYYIEGHIYKNRDESVYFERELLTRSIEGRRVEILTISDMVSIYIYVLLYIYIYVLTR